MTFHFALSSLTYLSTPLSDWVSSRPQGHCLILTAKTMTFTSLTGCVPLLSGSLHFFLPNPESLLLIRWYGCFLWRTGNENFLLFFLFCKVLLPLFIAEKPWISATTLSHSYNELILQEGRIASYLCREGRHLRLSLSSSVLPVHIIVAKRL